MLEKAQQRIVIVGGPKTGKTTFVESWPHGPVFHTDDLMDLDWEAVPDRVIEWMQQPGPWVIEGVQTARALRRWLKKAEALGWSGTPCDRVVVMSHPFVELTNRQAGMAKGIWKIWKEVEQTLSNRSMLGPEGVEVEYR